MKSQFSLLAICVGLFVPLTFSSWGGGALSFHAEVGDSSDPTLSHYELSSPLWEESFDEELAPISNGHYDSIEAGNLLIEESEVEHLVRIEEWYTSHLLVDVSNWVSLPVVDPILGIVSNLEVVRPASNQNEEPFLGQKQFPFCLVFQPLPRHRKMKDGYFQSHRDRNIESLVLYSGIATRVVRIHGSSKQNLKHIRSQLLISGTDPPVGALA